MPPTNDFVPFCNESTGTNLPTQSSYLANPNLPIGNQPGIASSSFNNKPLRQATTIASVMAQIAADFTGADMLDNQNTADHAIPAALKAAMTASLKRFAPVHTTYSSSSGNHNLTYRFEIATGSATAAATYSDGTTTFTVSTTVASGTELVATGPAAPTVSGTLTKLSGAGDATITFYAFRAPLFLRVRLVGGGGGGRGTNGTGQSDGGGGGSTTFSGTNASLTGGGGSGGSLANSSSSGGTASGGDLNIIGGEAGIAAVASTTSGNGGSSLLGFGGTGSAGSGTAANSFGGGGASGQYNSANASGGTGGGYVEKLVPSPSGQYAYAVGAAGTAGSASVWPGGAGAAGVIFIEEHYQ